VNRPFSFSKFFYFFFRKNLNKFYLSFAIVEERFLIINNFYMNQFNLEDFEKLKILVNTAYKKIGYIYSPALKSKIVFNSNGIYHLHYDYNRSRRSKIVQWDKLRFFQEAVDVLKIATTIQEYRRIDCFVKDEKNIKKSSIIEWFAFWAIISFKNKTRIKIIVRRIGGDDGRYHFWSLMPYWTLRHKERVIGSNKLENE